MNISVQPVQDDVVMSPDYSVAHDGSHVVVFHWPPMARSCVRHWRSRSLGCVVVEYEHISIYIRDRSLDEQLWSSKALRAMSTSQ
jgi:hypothetical protein